MITISVILIIINVAVSWKGFNDRLFYERYAFKVERLLLHKEYFRLITSAFLHVNWMHLIWNMIALYAFSDSVETYLGPLQFLLIYFASMIAGDLLSLFIHRHHGDFGSVGASAAVNGIIFAAIAIFPGMKIGFFFLPLDIPAWLFGLAYVLISIYGIRSRNNNVGHEAHLGGALVGMLIGIIMFPDSLTENYLPILAITIPSLIFMFTIIKKPHALLVDNNYFKTHQRYYSPDHRYNAERASKQKELDDILDKINRKGIKSLTPKEKELLQKYSKTLR